MQKNPQPELLAPAGSMESLLAAVRCGADAVYVGASQFSARASAENFDEKTLMEAAEICHRSKVKLYLAVNTLLFDDEFPELDAWLGRIAEIGVDACIVQDLGVAAYIRKRLPTMPLHASTQMTIHTVGDLAQASEFGFVRAVVARELSCEQIARLCEAGSAMGIEIEAFVHGAHCMSVSGQCWMSAGMGGRSANRGRCAQPCRLPFTADTENSAAYALSLRDMCLAEHIGKIREIGVASLKIEGRMKRPEYVAAAVTAYRRALSDEQPDLNELQAVFSRSGFTDGYFTGIRNEMFGIRAKEDVLAAQDVLNELRIRYQKPRKSAMLEAVYTVLPEQPSQLTVSDDDGHRVTVTGTIPQTARTHPTDLEQLQKQFYKLGDTIYAAGKVSAVLDGTTMLPVSELNAMRRKAVAAMDAARIADYTPKHTLGAEWKMPREGSLSPKTPKIRLQIRSLSQLDRIADLADRMDALLLPLYLVPAYVTHSSLIPAERCIIVPPRFILDETQVARLLRSAYNLGFTRLSCQHIGMLGVGKKLGMTLHGGLGLHMTNSYTRHVLAEYGVADAMISPEVPLSRARKMSETECKLSALTYGKLPFMLTRNCPVRSQIGCKNCRHALIDRKGKPLYVDCTRYAENPDYAELFNALPIWQADKKELYEFADYSILYMTDENAERVREILESYTDETLLSPPEQFSRGLHLIR